MKTLLVAALFVLATAAPAQADDHPKPKGNDTGCCFSFDNSPVTIVLCQVPNSCTIGGKP